VKAAKTRKNTVSKLIIDDWGYAIEIIKTDVVRETDEVTTDTRSEEFDNQKQNADDDIPQRVQSHLQLQEHLRQVQEDCRGGVHGQS
jgi:pantothenate synthetase